MLVTVAKLLVAPTTHARWDGGLSLSPGLHRGHHRRLQPGPGALVGGFVVGLLQNWSAYYLSSAYRERIPCCC